MIAPHHRRPARLAPLPFPTPPARSDRARQITRLFGLVDQPTPDPPPPPLLTSGLPLPEAGKLLFITGPSGAGKSLRLRRLCVEASRQNIRLVRVDRVRLRPVPCVDQLGDNLQLAVDLLSRVGLAEAMTFLRLPDELSDGQRWRLRLAVAIYRLLRQGGLDRKRGARPRRLMLVSDEFCAVLDRISAAVVARCLRRTIDRLARVGVPVRAAVATSHDDLTGALLPDLVAHVDFDGVRLTTHPVPG